MLHFLENLFCCKNLKGKSLLDRNKHNLKNLSCTQEKFRKIVLQVEKVFIFRNLFSYVFTLIKITNTLYYLG